MTELRRMLRVGAAAIKLADEGCWVLGGTVGLGTVLYAADIGWVVRCAPLSSRSNGNGSGLQKTARRALSSKTRTEQRGAPAPMSAAHLATDAEGEHFPKIETSH